MWFWICGLLGHLYYVFSILHRIYLLEVVHHRYQVLFQQPLIESFRAFLRLQFYTIPTIIPKILHIRSRFCAKLLKCFVYPIHSRKYSSAKFTPKLVILTTILAPTTTIRTTYECAFIRPSNKKKTGSEFHTITPSYTTKETQAYATRITCFLIT